MNRNPPRASREFNSGQFFRFRMGGVSAGRSLGGSVSVVVMEIKTEYQIAPVGCFGNGEFGLPAVTAPHAAREILFQ
jgi:hypothetical protein